MGSTPDITILCATLNGRDAVRLTMSSLRRHTPESYRILVADNGSTDGTLEYLRGLDWIELFKHDRRCRNRSHGATLDWLARKVETRYFLTLDSDVAFLRSAWLSELRRALEVRRAVAVGEPEPGTGSYRPRLAPYVLLFDTARFRALDRSFESCATFHDPVEARRWRGRAESGYLGEAELGTYRSAAFYSTGALLFERILATRERWVRMPLRTRRKYIHFGHMSWGDAATPVAGQHGLKLAAVRQLLRQYDG
jgi:glycosyltransferase involved in cell wall biosynthesis